MRLSSKDSAQGGDSPRMMPQVGARIHQKQQRKRPGEGPLALTSSKSMRPASCLQQVASMQSPFVPRSAREFTLVISPHNSSSLYAGGDVRIVGGPDARAKSGVFVPLDPGATDPRFNSLRAYSAVVDLVMVLHCSMSASATFMQVGRLEQLGQNQVTRF